MKPPLRTKSVGTKVSEAEFALLEERARGAGMRLGEWVREAVGREPFPPTITNRVPQSVGNSREARTVPVNPSSHKIIHGRRLGHHARRCAPL